MSISSFLSLFLAALQFGGRNPSKKVVQKYWKHETGRLTSAQHLECGNKNKSMDWEQVWIILWWWWQRYDKWHNSVDKIYQQLTILVSSYVVLLALQFLSKGERENVWDPRNNQGPTVMYCHTNFPFYLTIFSAITQHQQGQSLSAVMTKRILPNLPHETFYYVIPTQAKLEVNNL